MLARVDVGGALRPCAAAGTTARPWRALRSRRSSSCLKSTRHNHRSSSSSPSSSSSAASLARSAALARASLFLTFSGCIITLYRK